MKAKNKLLVTMVAIVLIACTGVILIGNLSKGFQNMDPTEWQLHEVNEENLYQAFTFKDVEDRFTDGAKGVTATIDDDNIIAVKGTAEEAITLDIGTYTLKKGTSYVFNSGVKGSTGSIYVRLINVNTNTELKSSFGSSVVIKGEDLTADTTVMLQICVAKNAEVNVKVKPILCIGTSGEDLVEFYK